jgi:3-methyladenine DNA glycosylase Tag
MSPAHPQPKGRDMSAREVIDELDRCKTALQVVAEMQSDGLATLLEILLECLDDAIGQVQAHIQQCTCQDQSSDADTGVPLRRGALTMYKRPKHVLSSED